jgi:hypothetical protein
VCRPLPHAGPPVPGVESWSLPCQAVADRDAARVGPGQSSRARKAAWGWRMSFALPGAGSGTGRRSIVGILRALAVERQRASSPPALTPAGPRGPAALVGGPTMWQSRPHHGLSRDLGDLRPHASRKSPRSTKRRRKRPHKSRERGQNGLYSGRESHSADPPSRWADLTPGAMAAARPRSWPSVSAK